ncbi:MAG: hypothetical protein HC908_12550 [Calothrix sp. SM1_7_51]|nr:hypothetical protein [Calothrix sp. SM1_7_51]
MTDTNNPNQEIYTLLAELTRRQLQTESNLQGTQAKIDRTQEQIERTQEQVERTQTQLELTQVEVSETSRQLRATQFEVDRIMSNIETVVNRNEVLNGILLELRNNQDNYQARFDRHISNFEEIQRTSNAALERLEAILMRLIRDSN